VLFPAPYKPTGSVFYGKIHIMLAVIMDTREGSLSGTLVGGMTECFQTDLPLVGSSLSYENPH